MQTAQELYDELCQPFPVEMIEWRVGATRKPYDKEVKEGKFQADDTVGKPLCYIDARAAMDRLDTACGPENWQCNYSAGVNGSIICNLGLRMPDGSWVWKADGAGATDFEGEKGALSDAFKRAAVRWGLGRYLYELDAPPIALLNGKYITPAAKKQLAEFYEAVAPKALWGVRGGIQAYKLVNAVVKDTVTDPASAQSFREKHKGMIPQLPVAMRQHLNETLDRAGAENQEAA